MSAPFIDRLAFDKANLKIINENRSKEGSLTTLKKSFLGQLYNNVKANWLMLVFVLPIVAWMIVSQIWQVEADTSIAYSGNLGLGYPVVTDAAIVGAAKDLELAMQRALIMMPLIIIGSLGLAGVFNVVKYFCWGFQIKIIKTFFRGIKNSFAPFLWVGMMLAVCFLLFTFVLNIFNVYTDVHLAWQILSYIAVALLCLVVILLSLFVTTQAAVLNLTLLEILKNSFLLNYKFILQSIIVAIIGLVTMALPLLTFNSFVQVIAYVIFFMLAFSWMALVWTIYSHYILDMLYVEKISQKDDAPTPQKPKEIQVQKKSESKKTYQNPKKKKKN